jgi:hypothetical protein
VATYRVPHLDIDRAVIHRDPPIADQLMTTPHAAAKLGLLTEESSA